MISNFRKLLKISSVDITESGSQFFDDDFDEDEGEGDVDTGNYIPDCCVTLCHTRFINVLTIM